MPSYSSLIIVMFPLLIEASSLFISLTLSIKVASLPFFERLMVSTVAKILGEAVVSVLRVTVCPTL